MLGLGIETSCDDTCLAIVENGKKCLANLFYSQNKVHAPFGGVVPELASRAHLEKINFLYEELKLQTGLTYQDLDYIAVSTQPGLLGSLMIGACFGKALALVSQLPIIKVEHIEAHLYAPYIEGEKWGYPFLGLLLSGGNSAIYQVEGVGKLYKIADTWDDACGEAFDKVASILLLAYPGGPLIEKYAKSYEKLMQKNEKKEILFQPLLRHLSKREIAFSFSGIKTGVLRVLEEIEGQENYKEKISYHFQKTVFELIEKNIKKASKLTGISRIVAGGGVLANQSLRDNLDKLAQSENWTLLYPKDKVLCTDNAAMVACLGYHIFSNAKLEERQKYRNLGFEVDSRSHIPSK